VSANFSYDGLSRPLTAAYGNGTSASWSWNSAGLMEGYRWQSPGAELFDRSYGYDKLRRLTERREGRYRWDYEYDAAGRLAEAGYPKGLFENIRAWQDGQFPPGHAAEYGDIYRGVPASSKPGGMPPGQAKKPGTGEAWDDEMVLPELVDTERWSYDDAANITERRRDGQREDFQYSALNRLMRAGDITYHYNQAG
jgi:YD repeat-containing protein